MNATLESGRERQRGLQDYEVRDCMQTKLARIKSNWYYSFRRELSTSDQTKRLTQSEQTSKPILGSGLAQSRVEDPGSVVGSE